MVALVPVVVSGNGNRKLHHCVKIMLSKNPSFSNSIAVSIEPKMLDSLITKHCLELPIEHASLVSDIEQLVIPAFFFTLIMEHNVTKAQLLR